MNNITEVLELIQMTCKPIDDIRISIYKETINIYWENLEVSLTAAEVPTALQAIQTLNELGATFA